MTLSVTAERLADCHLGWRSNHQMLRPDLRLWLCLLGLMLAGGCASTGGEKATLGPPLYPGKLELQYTERLIILSDDSPHKGRYAEYVDKKDIVWTGDKVVIDTALYSNGGDVLILADEVELCAPIDTRVYLDHSGEDIQQTTGQCLSADHYYRDVYDGLHPKNSPAKPRLHSYYDVGRPVWDDAQKKWVTRKSQRSPELPGGMTPCARPGEVKLAIEFPEAAVNYDAARSGNISIVAREIRACPALANQPNPPDLIEYRVDRPECANSPLSTLASTKGESRQSSAVAGIGDARSSGHFPGARDPYETGIPAKDRSLLIAGGMYGGKPGLPLRGCEYFDDFEVSKNCKLQPTASSAGIKGGAAGAIEVLLVGGDENTTRQLIESRTTAFGGSNYKVPLYEKCPDNAFELSHKCAPLSLITSRCSLNSLPQLPTPIVPDGPIVFSSRSSGNALNWFASELLRVEGKADHDYREQIESLAPYGYLETGTTSDMLTAYLEVSVQRANAIVSRSLKKGASQQQPLPGVLQDVDTDKLAYPAFTFAQRDLVGRLEQFRPIAGTPPVTAFLIRSGGLLWSETDQPGQTLGNIALQGAVTHLENAVNALDQSVIDMHVDLHRYITHEEKKKYEAMVKDIAVKLAAAEAEARKHEDKFGMIIDAIGGVVELGKDAFAAFESGQYHKMAKPLYGIYRSIKDIEDEWNKDPSHDINELRALLKESQEALSSFLAQAQAEKEVLLRKKQGQVDAAFDAAKSYYQLARQARDLHGDFQRLNLATYLRDIEIIGAENRFEQNQTKLIEFAESYPASKVVFDSIDTFKRDCESTDIPVPIEEVVGSPQLAGCIQGVPKNKISGWFIEAAPDDPLRFFDGMPLYAFKPKGPTKPYDTHGWVKGVNIVDHTIDAMPNAPGD